MILVLCIKRAYSWTLPEEAVPGGRFLNNVLPVVPDDVGLLQEEPHAVRQALQLLRGKLLGLEPACHEKLQVQCISALLKPYCCLTALHIAVMHPTAFHSPFKIPGMQVLLLYGHAIDRPPALYRREQTGDDFHLLKTLCSAAGGGTWKGGCKLKDQELHLRQTDADQTCHVVAVQVVVLHSQDLRLNEVRHALPHALCDLLNHLQMAYSVAKVVPVLPERVSSGVCCCGAWTWGGACASDRYFGHIRPACIDPQMLMRSMDRMWLGVNLLMRCCQLQVCCCNLGVVPHQPSVLLLAALILPIPAIIGTCRGSTFASAQGVLQMVSH